MAKVTNLHGQNIEFENISFEDGAAFLKRKYMEYMKLHEPSILVIEDLNSAAYAFNHIVDQRKIRRRQSPNSSKNPIRFNGVLCGLISKNLVEIHRAIEDSAKEFQLFVQENWDDEGAKAYSKLTWINAINLIVNLSETFLKKGIILPTPEIEPGASGSIDIIWTAEQYELCICIPEESQDYMFTYRQLRASAGASDNGVNGTEALNNIDILEYLIVNRNNI